MPHSSESYQFLIDQLINAQSFEEVTNILSTSSELLTVGLADQLEEYVKAGKAPTGLLNYINSIVCRNLTVQWLNTPDDQQEAFLHQHQHRLFSNTAFDLLKILADEHEDGKEYIDRRITILTLRVLMSFLSEDNEAHRHHLLVEANQLLLSEFVLSLEPALWARLQVKFGNLLVQLTPGDQVANQKRAVQAYEQALTVRTQETMPVEWAETLYTLGSVHLMHFWENPENKLEEAIKNFEQALTVLTKEAMPVLWAMALNNLGAAYVKRIRGDRATNQEKAIWALEQALTVRTQEAMPIDWAITINNVGAVYGERIRGDRAANQEKAIWALEQALTVRTQETMPLDWAISLSNLGLIYSERIQEDRATNQEKAIWALEQALTVLDQETTPIEWAGALYNLGNVYARRIQGNRLENQERAIKDYEQALMVRTREAMPLDWASTLNNLGAVHLDRILGDGADNQDKAIRAFQQVLEVSKPYILPESSRRTASVLGGIFIRSQQWQAAREALEIAHQAAENERQQQNIADRQQLARETRELYADLVYTCLQTGDESAAFEYVLAAKGRADAERLGEMQSLEQLVAQYSEMADAYRYIRQLRQTIHELSTKLESEAKRPVDRQLGNADSLQQYDETANILQQTRYQLSQAMEQLALDFPLATSIQYTPGLSSQVMLDLANELDATIIEYFRLRDDLVAFVVSPNNSISYVLLPRSIFSLIKYQFLPNSSQSVLLSYQDDYPLYERRLFATLYKYLITPIAEHLPPKGRVVIAPDGILHRIPFGALWDKSSTDRLGDRFTLSTVPSLSFLHKLVKQRKNKRSHSVLPSQGLLSVVYPGSDPAASTYLQFVHKEANEVARHFAHAKQLHDQDARPNQLIEICQNETFSAIHFGCHGYFDASNPDYSYLSLNGDLTVQQIINELRIQNAPLVTLGACQTGLAYSTSGGDLIGLAQALFMAGADTVIASLWSVEDQSTQELFRHFYQKRTEPGVSEAAALQFAQQQLRKNPTWQDAYYWAAFQVIGLPL